MTNATGFKYIYFLNNALYINVTNLCTNECVFCIKNLSESVSGVNLKLEDEYIEPKDIIKEIQSANLDTCSEIVFCGYGEPFIKLDLVKEVAGFIKKNYPQIPVRINTNGHGNLIWKRNVVPELVGLIDSVSVSLNAENAELYAEIARSKFKPDKAFDAVKDFVSQCVKNNIKTTVSIVKGYENFTPDENKCREIAEELGADFRIREWLSEGYA